ncbi:MAG TPA: hypothetical protein VLD37_00430 [Candidatus Bilamarchaeum sp.]|nr:hypothetical protein [Candidatus Bilamarchaeum sp.]
MNRNILFVAGLLLLLGCASAPKYDREAALGESFNLSPGESAHIATDGIVVRFINVTEDSRCPSDVVCIWAGQVKAEVEFSAAGEVSRFNLTSTAGKIAESEFDFINRTYVLSMLKVEPYPKSTDGKRNYTATFRVDVAAPGSKIK